MGLQQGLDAIQLIHQAFEQGYQGELQRKKQSQDQEMQLLENQRLEEANKRANDELELHRKTTEAQLQSHIAQLNQMHFENKTKLMDMLRSGALPGNTTQTSAVGQDYQGNDIPNAQGQTQITQKNPVSFGEETVNDYQLPGEVAQQQADQQKTILSQLAPVQANAEALKTTAQLRAAEPFKQAENQRDITKGVAIQAPEIASREKIAQQAQAGENARAQLNASTTIAGHNIAAAASNFNARANNFMLPEQQTALTSQAQLVAGGAAKLPSGKAGEMIQQILGNAGGQSAPDPKNIEKIKALPAAFDTIKMVNDFTQKYATNDKIKAFLNGKISDKDLPTDIRADLNALNTRAIPFSKSFEGTQGIKFTNQDLQLILKGMVNAGATSTQNKVLGANLNSMVQKGAVSTLSQYPPEQREHILTTQGFFNDLPDTSKAGGKLDKQATINLLLKTGKWSPIYN